MCDVAGRWRPLADVPADQREPAKSSLRGGGRKLQASEASGLGLLSCSVSRWKLNAKTLATRFVS